MSEPLNLIPNLNENMEEYAKQEKEAVQTTQAETRQEGERVESRAEVEQPIEETRKRKRGTEEAGVEAMEKKKATGFQGRLMSLGGINCNKETS